MESSAILAEHGPDRPYLFGELNARYGLEMNFDSVESLGDRPPPGRLRRVLHAAS